MLVLFTSQSLKEVEERGRKKRKQVSAYLHLFCTPPGSGESLMYNDKGKIPDVNIGKYLRGFFFWYSKVQNIFRCASKLNSRTQSGKMHLQ